MMLEEYVNEQGRRAKEAARILATVSSERKNAALRAMARALRDGTNAILEANAGDLEAGRKAGLTPPLLERLTLNDARIEGMARGLDDIAAFGDPVGEMTGMWTAEQGLRIGYVRVPLGVIGVIYESRPNVTADAAGLCLKAGNAVILRGGSEALGSNRVIARLIAGAAENEGLPAGAIQLLDSADREATRLLMQLTRYLDVLIPRGGKGLKNAVQEHAKVPYIMTGMGNCHIFVDATADLEKAVPIVVNAKVQRPSVCNAIEKILVHEAVAERFLPMVASVLREKGVELRGDDASRRIVPDMIPATEEDWDTEYLDLILGVRVVAGIREAMDHIAAHGTGHSEAILTESYENAQAFLGGVDAAAVYVNASTRFTDGAVFGFGAEIGISTQKLHTRGPMGVRQLTSNKYVIYGNGQIRGA
jgi:glutamate-5-semialdehyde dehydrogenase